MENLKQEDITILLSGDTELNLVKLFEYLFIYSKTTAPDMKYVLAIYRPGLRDYPVFKNYIIFNPVMERWSLLPDTLKDHKLIKRVLTITEFLVLDFYNNYTDKGDKYFLQDSKSGMFVQGLWKLLPDGRIYFWSAHEKWEYAIERNKKEDKLFDLTETTKENVYRYINKKPDENKAYSLPNTRQ